MFWGIMSAIILAEIWKWDFPNMNQGYQQLGRGIQLLGKKKEWEKSAPDYYCPLHVLNYHVTLLLTVAPLVTVLITIFF
jgi:hypothetical protein